MHVSYFVTYTDPTQASRISDVDAAKLADLLAGAPGLAKAHVYAPTEAKDYFTADGSPPAAVLQIDFTSIEALESAIGRDGHLQALVGCSLPSLDACTVTQQAMMNRPFPVLEPVPQAPDDYQRCTFLVHYPGQAENFGAWINHYLEHHPQIMKFFPGIREIEIFTRVDWLDAMPWPRVDYMQRNKVVFDNAEALTAALHSSVRHDMRADFESFPAYTGSNIHHPMTTRTVVGSAG